MAAMLGVYLACGPQGWTLAVAFRSACGSWGIVGKINPVIHLDKIENDRIYYFISWDKVKYNYYEGVIK